MPESKPMKRLIVFDLDGTLAESKSSLDSEMTELLHKLLDDVFLVVLNPSPIEKSYRFVSNFNAGSDRFSLRFFFRG